MTDNISNKSPLDFASLQAIISTENVIAHGAEIHGILTGLISAGFTFEEDSYLAMITDLLHNGEALPDAVNNTIKVLYNELWQNIVDDNYSFEPLLPDDDDCLAERSNALCAWAQGFTLGFGLQQKNSRDLPSDIQEILTDFIEIANLSDEIDDDETNERAFYEVVEYVRISALLCFSEFGIAPEKPSAKEILH